jgi:hypothetical protein
MKPLTIDGITGIQSIEDSTRKWLCHRSRRLPFRLGGGCLKTRNRERESEKELENLFNSLMQRAFRGELVKLFQKR